MDPAHNFGAKNDQLSYSTQPLLSRFAREGCESGDSRRTRRRPLIMPPIVKKLAIWAVVALFSGFILAFIFQTGWPIGVGFSVMLILFLIAWIKVESADY